MHVLQLSGGQIVGFTCVLQACNLQVHGMYSMKRMINSMPPASEETAKGIIMVHGELSLIIQ